MTGLSVKVLHEAGYREAMVGLALSKKQPIENMPALANRLAQMDDGHNKFLEQMMIWTSTRAPRFWWQEADTYRLSSKSSESTMHTLVQELQALPSERDNSWGYFITNNFDMCACVKENFREMVKAAKDNDLVHLKRLMPEGFLQIRMWMFSYKTLRNIYHQRKNHTLPHWHDFLDQIIDQIQFKELITC